jgi:hypothetical protein
MIVFVLVPPAIVRGYTDTATYVGGSVKSIPLDLIGSLDVSEKGELRFDYGTATYKLPCTQITSTAVTQGETRHILHRIPVPSLLPGRKKETLTVNFKDAAGANGTLNFELTATQASALLEIIAIKKATPVTASQSADDWWGDKYWKTTRNRADWEGGANPAAQTAQTVPGLNK